MLYANQYSIDIDHHQAAARQFKIGSLPTFVLYKSGHVVAQSSGFYNQKNFTAWLDAALAAP